MIKNRGLMKKAPQEFDPKVLEEAFRRLRPRHQQLIIWDRIEKLSYAEMAARLGLSREQLIRRIAATIIAWHSAVEDVEKGRKASLLTRAFRVAGTELCSSWRRPSAPEQ